MVSIDEVIAQEKELAIIFETKDFAEFHQQIAEWLEELKCYKNDNDFSDYADRLHKIAFNSGYNKALDDFVNACKSNTLCQTFGLRKCDIDELAEQLKAGVRE